MTPIRTVSLALLLLASVAACSARIGDRLPKTALDVLRSPDSMEILALHPFPHEAEGKPADEESSFHGYRILGRAMVPVAADRTHIVDLVIRGIEESDGTVAACFNPRHGIRARSGDREIDLVICYECLSMLVRGPGLEPASATTTQAPEAALREIWRSYGL